MTDHLKANEKVMDAKCERESQQSLTFVQDGTAGMMIHVRTFFGRRSWQIGEAIAVGGLISL